MAGKTVVLYKSAYGSAQRYAKAIGRQLNAQIFEITEFTGSLNDYDTIIFGGGLYAGGINGVKKFKKLIQPQLAKQKKLAVYFVGLSPVDNVRTKEIIGKNFTAEEQRNIRFFATRGDMVVKDLGFIHHAMMNMMTRSVAKKPQRTAEEEEMLRLYATGVMTGYDESFIQPLVSYCK